MDELNPWNASVKLVEVWLQALNAVYAAAQDWVLISGSLISESLSFLND